MRSCPGSIGIEKIVCRNDVETAKMRSKKKKAKFLLRKKIQIQKTKNLENLIYLGLGLNVRV